MGARDLGGGPGPLHTACPAAPRPAPPCPASPCCTRCSVKQPSRPTHRGAEQPVQQPAAQRQQGVRCKEDAPAAASEVHHALRFVAGAVHTLRQHRRIGKEMKCVIMCACVCVGRGCEVQAGCAGELLPGAMHAPAQSAAHTACCPQLCTPPNQAWPLLPAPTHRVGVKHIVGEVEPADDGYCRQHEPRSACKVEHPCLQVHCRSADLQRVPRQPCSS